MLKWGNNFVFVILLVKYLFRGETFTLSSVISHVLILQMAEDLIGGRLLGLHLAVHLPHRSSSTRSVVFFPSG